MVFQCIHIHVHNTVVVEFYIQQYLMMHIIISNTKYKTSISVGGFLHSSNSTVDFLFHLWLFLVCHPQDLQCPHLEAPFYISTGATASQSVGVYYGGSTEDG